MFRRLRLALVPFGSVPRQAASGVSLGKKVTDTAPEARQYFIAR